MPLLPTEGVDFPSLYGGGLSDDEMLRGHPLFVVFSAI